VVVFSMGRVALVGSLARGGGASWRMLLVIVTGMAVVPGLWRRRWRRAQRDHAEISGFSPGRGPVSTSVTVSGAGSCAGHAMASDHMVSSKARRSRDNKRWERPALIDMKRE
jgi:hypothetical protein